MNATWARAAECVRLMAPRTAVALLVISAIGAGHAAEHHKAADIDAARLSNAERDSANWLSYGRTYSEQRYSPLSQITADNAAKLFRF